MANVINWHVEDHEMANVLAWRVEDEKWHMSLPGV
jgi:hypothetical protein